VAVADSLLFSEYVQGAAYGPAHATSQEILRNGTQAGVSLATRGGIATAIDYLIVPVHLAVYGGHWTMARVCVRRSVTGAPPPRFDYTDSCGSMQEERANMPDGLSQELGAFPHHPDRRPMACDHTHATLPPPTALY
jgi:hypothetical protein